ncbi:ATP-binding cassette domain-containing protein [Mesorhizobium sp. BAC0120]|uniref:ATP-binding cassette domain-containing protein n=1 Tax=Mesorhizobium sp. BAC0120 TaxID=3090670 RepID=UPI00298BE1CF|nr:ATP-binding cassette domain-containing protein [Mesorhizobium sp. BAC0120]MDW6021242.1 ATP-binding cassette domain-containing protein [Mesorhizobium sp. BAC0120]
MSTLAHSRTGSPASAGEPSLALEGIGKAFGQVKALTRVDLTAYPGEIHFVVGDNGAGKSTTLKILSGMFRPDVGSVRIGGIEVHMRDAAEARQFGIAVVHQDLALVECLDIATNMALGDIPRRGRIMLDRARMERDAAKVLSGLKIRVGSVRTQIGLLSGGERQIVAIARAVRTNLPIILLDEPTAALGVRETAHVGEILDELRAQGKTIICISHDLEFVFRHADRITVMRLGNSVATLMRGSTNRDAVVGMITGTIGAAAESAQE